MRVFAGEFVCGGGFAHLPLDQIPSSLRQEGLAMLRAIATDLSGIADVVACLDPRFQVDIEGVETIAIDSGQTLFGQWIAAAQNCDAALIVAPENDGVLAKAVGALRSRGVDVIASSRDFLRVASDKLQTAKTLLAAGVAHPPFLAAGDDRLAKQVRGHEKFIVKPRDGCGTQAIEVFDSFSEALSHLTEGSILQPWLGGQPISVSLVAAGTTRTFLPAVTQQICAETCSYAGGCGPLGVDAQRRAAALAHRAVAAMPPQPRGFVGVDLMLGNCPDEDYVIEINPRLTTSYVGLRKMISGNLAARLFDLESGPVSCVQPVESVRWIPAGQVWVNDQLVSESVADHA